MNDGSGKPAQPPIPADDSLSRLAEGDFFRSSRSADVFPAGTVLGQRYEILALLGQGGMGAVYRAYDRELERTVAIKMILPELADDPAALQRFKRELVLAREITHRNVVRLYDLAEADGLKFLTMEYIEGENLGDILQRRGKLTIGEVIDITHQLCAGLGAAHEQGVIHRDLKPQNIMRDGQGRVALMDFGLARTTESRGTTHTGVLVGTAEYMSPEQATGAPVDARSDVFTVGLILYEMLTGKQPYQADSTVASLLKRCQEPVAPPSSVDPNFPDALDDLVMRCLEINPAKRYQSVAAVAADLQAWEGRGREDTESRPFAEVAAVKQPVSEGSRTTRNRWKILAPIGILLAVLAVVAALSVARGRKTSAPTRATQPGKPSIAVLPFVNMSSDKEQEYFSDGLAEELLNDLVKIQGLRVAARTSSFQFKSTTEDLRRVGEKLNVGAILEGSVRKEGKKVRITAQLINVADGFHLWSETYDRELSDIFAVQDDIARSVAASLKVVLLGGTTTTPSAKGKNVDAYNAYLLGRYFDERRGKDNFEKAVGYYEQAIRLDPSYAPAWAGLAETRSRQASGGYLPMEEAYQKAREAAERAVALDPNLAEAHAALGWVKQSHDWDWSSADACYQRALALEPGNIRVIRYSSFMAATLGRFEQALALNRRAVELDPLSAAAYDDVGFYSFRTGRLEEAVAAFKKALEINPLLPAIRAFLGRVYLAQGHPHEALAEMEREPEAPMRLQGLALAYHALGWKKESDAALAELIAKYHAAWAFQVAEVYAVRGEANRAFEWLERAYRQRDVGLAEMKGDPLLKNLERDPRYNAFLKKMRLPT